MRQLGLLHSAGARPQSHGYGATAQQVYESCQTCSWPRKQTSNPQRWQAANTISSSPAAKCRSALHHKSTRQESKGAAPIQWP